VGLGRHVEPTAAKRVIGGLGSTADHTHARTRHERITSNHNDEEE
jgi:hypothetical protein